MTRLPRQPGLAFSTLRGNPLRSLLTLLGIVIGAATVVAMMSLIEGLPHQGEQGPGRARRRHPSRCRSGRATFGHWTGPSTPSARDLTREQGEALRSLPHVGKVSIEAYHRDPERVTTRERATKPNIDVAGGVPDYQYAQCRRPSPTAGSSPTPTWRWARRVAVVGADVADVLFPGESAVGKEIRVRSVPFTVVGVAERRGTTLGRQPGRLGGHPARSVLPGDRQGHEPQHRHPGPDPPRTSTRPRTRSSPASAAPRTARAPGERLRLSTPTRPSPGPSTSSPRWWRRPPSR